MALDLWGAKHTVEPKPVPFPSRLRIAREATLHRLQHTQGDTSKVPERLPATVNGA